MKDNMNKAMTIQEVKISKQSVEGRIGQMLTDLQEDTGFLVKGVRVIQGETLRKYCPDGHEEIELKVGIDISLSV